MRSAAAVCDYSAGADDNRLADPAALPSVDQLRQAGAFVLIFACLLPTLTLVRATALTMPSVMDTQRRLGQLPQRHLLLVCNWPAMFWAG